MKQLFGLIVLAAAAASQALAVVRFGIITDVHYADAPADGSRVYRDSIPKVEAAVKSFAQGPGTDFMIELGDFKDTDATQGCAGPGLPSDHCTNITIGFLQKIEDTVAVYTGNHDVDILNQSSVFANIHDSNAGGMHVEVGGQGYSSWQPGPPTNTTNATGSDTKGCLATDIAGKSVWIVHADGTRNWLSTSTKVAASASYVVDDINSFPKRHGGSGAYVLNAEDSAVAIAQRCRACTCNQSTGRPLHLPTPAPPSAAGNGPIRFVALNADYTNHDLEWNDLNNPSKVPGMSWEAANVPSFQLEWLALQLNAALALRQHVVVFVHYRVDGGPGGPVGTGIGPAGKAGFNRGWVDDCSLQNSAVVRALLEEHPGLVLATFSGHDHAPNPLWTKETATTPMYFTHPAIVEGSFSAGRNAYSIVTIEDDCTIVVHGFADAENVTVIGPPGHTCTPNTTIAE